MNKNFKKQGREYLPLLAIVTLNPSGPIKVVAVIRIMIDLKAIVTKLIVRKRQGTSHAASELRGKLRMLDILEPNVREHLKVAAL